MDIINFKKIRFSYIENIKRPIAIDCTRDRFVSAIDSKAVEELADKIAVCEDNEQRAELKKCLPVFCFHASFPNGKRGNKEAVASGLFIIDVDHPAEPAEDIWLRISAGLEKSGWKVYIAHMTPSGGLRLVVRRRDGMGIADCQKMFSDEFGIENDDHVKDLARCSFAVPRKYFFHFDDSVFTDTMPICEVTKDDAVETTEDDTVEISDAGAQDVAEVKVSGEPLFDGIPYRLIAQRFAERKGWGVIKEGERNQKLFQLALSLRTICDYNPGLLASILPETYPPLPKSELMGIAKSACKRGHELKTDPDLLSAIEEIRAECETETDGVGEGFDAYRSLPMPNLPKIFKTFTRLCPQQYSEVVVLSLLPVLGFLGTGIRGFYNVNEPTRMNFQTVVVGPPASCKSRVLRLVTEHLLKRMREKEMEMRRKEAEYEEHARRNSMKSKSGKNGGIESAPKFPIRIVPASISVSKFLYRMDNADGEHLFSVENEIGTVSNTNNSGAWANKMEIYKNAFDNEVYGQDYRSTDSYSAMLPIAYNYLFAGTYEAALEFYNQKAVKTGLATRTIVAYVHETYNEERPVFKSLSEKDKVYVDSLVELLVNYNKEVKCPKVDKEIYKWLVSHKKWANEADDAAMKFFLHRAAAIGDRAGKLAYVLEGEKENKKVVEFAVWVANTVMFNQIRLWGRFAEDSSMPACVAKKNIFKELGDSFTYSDLMKKLGSGTSSANMRKIVSRWKQAKLIVKESKGVFVKTRQKTSKIRTSA